MPSASIASTSADKPENRFANLRRRNFAYRAAFSLFPLSILLMSAVAGSWIMELGLSPALLALVAAAAVASIPLSVSLWHEAERGCQVESLRMRAEALEEQRKITAAYVDQLAADEENIIKMREQVSEEIAMARTKLQECNHEATMEHFTDALRIIGDESLALCQHPALNVLATMKAASCRDAGINPEFALDIPEDAGIPPVELCSVVGNLVDNGLAAAVRAKEEVLDSRADDAAALHPTSSLRPNAPLRSEPPESNDFTLQVRGRISKGHLVINVTNPASAADREKLRKSQATSVLRFRKRSTDAHGWGLPIVQSIATSHDGSLAIEIDGDNVTTRATLRLPTNANEGAK